MWSIDETIHEWTQERSPSCGRDLGGHDKPAVAREPSCVYTAHQSGVNDIALHTVGECNNNIIIFLLDFINSESTK